MLQSDGSGYAGRGTDSFREYRARGCIRFSGGIRPRRYPRIVPVEELYQIEYGTLPKGAALHPIRRLAARRGLANPSRVVAKAMLPATAVHALRRVRGGSLSGAEEGLSTAPLLKRFSTRDRRYASTDLEQARWTSWPLRPVLQAPRQGD